MPPRIRKKNYKRKVKTVTVVIEKGLVSNVVSPKDINVVIQDYDIENRDFTEAELKTDTQNRRYTEEVWEGEDA
jgi:hypothetical protein